jgi:signal transduction histidine kinase
VKSALDETHLMMMRGLELNSLIIVPLQGNNRILGTLALVHSRSDRRYGPDDVNLALELARRAGLAIENAKLFSDLREAVRSRDEFLSIASHELRTPLTPMKIQIQSLKRAADSGKTENLSVERIQKVLAVSDKQLTRLTVLIDDMLDVARINAGKLTLNTETRDLCDLIREVTERLAQQAAASGIRFELGLPPSAVAAFDSLRVEQVMINLLTNAIKYASGKPVRISVEEEAEELRVSIRDNGEGIPKADLLRIFDRFERVGTSSTMPGLGLGLYISRQIVEAHGGKLWAESELGAGTVFKFTLPRIGGPGNSG